MPQRPLTKCDHFVKSARAELGLTQQELADLLGIKNRSSITCYEKGKSIPNGNIILHIIGLLSERKLSSIIHKAH